MYQHVRMVLQDREGNPLREEDRCTATSLSTQNNTSGIPSDWILLDFYTDGYLSPVLHPFQHGNGGGAGRL